MDTGSSDPGLQRDHLFISYAWEDQAFARWLALRLTAEGYKVWFDQIKLLGGESWPRDIDLAIKTRTFRMLGLLSKHSIAKPNPVKERTLALNTAKQPGRQGFLIPLNVDGLASTDLDWLTSDITFVPFSSSWAVGLAQLLKLLEREKCPKRDGDGRAAVSRIISTNDSVLDGADQLTTNACPFIRVPSQISAFIVSPKLENLSLNDALRDWSYYSVSPHRVLAFHPPDDQLATWLKTRLAQTYDWRSAGQIEGIDASNVVVRLLRGCIETRLRFLGFQWSASAEAFTFPGHFGGDVKVMFLDGSKTTVQHSGERTFFRIGHPKVPYRYRIAVKPSVERNFISEFSLLWRLRFHFTSTSHEPLAETQRQSRRKHLTRSWFNRHWLVRHLAAIQRAADHEGLIRVGPTGDNEVVLDCRPAAFKVNRTIDETKLVAVEEVGDDVPMDDERSDDDPDAEDHDD
jgi:hypothetical protein